MIDTEDGRLVYELEEIAVRWKDYLQRLYVPEPSEDVEVRPSQTERRKFQTLAWHDQQNSSNHQEITTSMRDLRNWISSIRLQEMGTFLLAKNDQEMWTAPNSQFSITRFENADDNTTEKSWNETLLAYRRSIWI